MQVWCCDGEVGSQQGERGEGKGTGEEGTGTGTMGIQVLHGDKGRKKKSEMKRKADENTYTKYRTEWVGMRAEQVVRVREAAPKREGENRYQRVQEKKKKEKG